MPTTLPLPTVGALALTRAGLGVGIGLLVAEHLEPRARRVVGGILVVGGAVATVPLVVAILRGRPNLP